MCEQQASREHQNKYDPNQARVPAGNPDGGQWTDDSRYTGQPSDVTPDLEVYRGRQICRLNQYIQLKPF